MQSRRWAPLLASALLASAALISVAAQPASASAALRVHAAEKGKFIGYATAAGTLSSDATYRGIAAGQFNQVTAENAMKWDATEPQDNQFNFGSADQIMAFAQANNQIVHGHTLVWHNQTPSWVHGLSATAMRAAMQDHIARVAGRYANNPAMKSWDVVNEVFNEDGSFRRSFWYNTMGSGFIADAFRFARAADPDARLCINDYNVEGINAKSTAMYNLVQQLRSQGVPVDCVGFQAHLAVQYGFPAQYTQNIARFAALGVQVRITELDIRIPLPADANEIATQNQYYANVVNGCLASSACAGVTLWGFTDRYSWVPGTFPGQGQALIYDNNYNQKPAYTAVHNALAAGGGGSTFNLVGTGSGRCAEVPGSSQTNGTGLVIWDCHTNANQRWTLTSASELRVYNNTKCMDGGAGLDGSRVTINSCTGGNNQKWTFNTNGTVRNVQSGRCLDVAGFGTGNNTAIQVWTCHTGSNQVWTRRP